MRVRADLTVQDGDRIDRLMEEQGEHHSTVGPRHDPYEMETTYFTVTSPLAKFLMRKGLLKPGQEIGVDRRRYFVSYTVKVAEVWESARYGHGLGARRWKISRISVG